MHRIDTPTAQKDKWGAGKNGYTDGDPTTGVKSTALNASIFDALQEEISNAIEKSGLELDPSDNTQLYKVLSAIGSAIGNYLKIENNLSEIAGNGTNAQSAARGNLGLKSAATHDVTTSHADTTAGHVLQVGDGGLLSSAGLVMGLVSQFLGYASADAEEVPANGAGWQSAYATSRRAQLFLDTVGHVWSRFSLSTDALDVDTPWALHYTTLNKPTASDTGALPIGGGTLTGPITILDDNTAITLKADTLDASLYIIFQEKDGSNIAYIGKGSNGIDDVAFSNYKGGNNAIILRADGSISITCAHGKNLSVTGEVVPSNYGNFDARYVSNIQLGAQVSVARDSGGNNKAAAGYVVTGAYSTYQDSNWEMDNLFCKPLQKYINGAWVTISG